MVANETLYYLYLLIPVYQKASVKIIVTSLRSTGCVAVITIVFTRGLVNVRLSGGIAGLCLGTTTEGGPERQRQ
jgi:hypothetical protein